MPYEKKSKGTRADAIEAMKRALVEVDKAQHSLNFTSHACADCGHTRYENWNEAQAYDQMKGIKTKLQRWIDRLSLPDDPKKGQNPDPFNAGRE